MKCPRCDQPMLPRGKAKRENEYDHANGCPLSYAAVSLAARLAEAKSGTAAMAAGYESQIAALRAELETTKARLAEAERENKELRDALAHQTSVADSERGRADRAEEALAECGRAGCPTAAGHQ